jgi:hypothetical protein
LLREPLASARSDISADVLTGTGDARVPWRSERKMRPAIRNNRILASRFCLFGKVLDGILGVLKMDFQRIDGDVGEEQAKVSNELLLYSNFYITSALRNYTCTFGPPKVYPRATAGENPLST